MSPAAPGSPVVHQVAFGVRPGRGLGPLAASFAVDDGGAAGWISRLEHHIRLKGLLDRPVPASALSHIDLGGGRCAVLLRWNTPGASGRNRSHALVGPSDLLLPSRTIGLRDWPWPTSPPPDGRLPTLAVDEVLASAKHGLAGLRDAAREVPDRVASAWLARLLDDPESPVCVVGCADDQRLPLLWLTYAASAAYLRHHGHHRPWTFSTYETEASGAVPATPDVVFAPGPLGDSATGRRITIDLDAPPSASARAIEVADLLLRNVRAGRTTDPATWPEPPRRRSPGSLAVTPPPDAAPARGIAAGRAHPGRHEVVPNRGGGLRRLVVAAVILAALVAGGFVGRATAPASTPVAGRATAPASTPPVAAPTPAPPLVVTVPADVTGSTGAAVYLWRPGAPGSVPVTLTPIAACTREKAPPAWVCRADPAPAGPVVVGVADPAAVDLLGAKPVPADQVRSVVEVSGR